MMRTRKKTRRLQLLGVGAVLMVAASALVFYAFDDTIAFFKSPTELSEGTFAPNQLLRVGGLVEEGSWQRGQGAENRFAVTDGNGVVTVTFVGILPDLFREGQGIVAEGYFRDGRFEATEVLAKHDENYMPKEVADALKEQGHFRPDAGS